MNITQFLNEVKDILAYGGFHEKDKGYYINPTTDDAGNPMFLIDVNIPFLSESVMESEEYKNFQTFLACHHDQFLELGYWAEEDTMLDEEHNCFRVLLSLTKIF